MTSFLFCCHVFKCMKNFLLGKHYTNPHWETCNMIIDLYSQSYQFHKKKEKLRYLPLIKDTVEVVIPVAMYGCESWTIKKVKCWRIDAFELWYWRRLESPLDCKEIQPVHPKGNQSWIFIGRTHAEAETPILWPPDAKNWLIWPWCWERLRWEEKGTKEDEMVGWQHRLSGHEFE